MQSLILAFTALTIPLTTQAASSFSLSKSYQGSSFFDSGNAFNFSSGIPNSNAGFATFVPYSYASANNLATVNAKGNAVVRVDNFTTPNAGDNTYGRSSVNMTSSTTIQPGSLLLIDSVHMPYGCSVWPGIYMIGANAEWPSKGEIDIYENVNLATVNQYSLHTLDGCQHPDASAVGSSEIGKLVSTDCFNQTNSNQGCIVQETKNGSFGAAFASNGGGALATLFAEDAISFWFFPRASVPSDFSSSSPDPTSWGTPSAYYPASSCDISKYFGEQTLVVGINICGNFAGGVYQETCQGQCVDVLDDPTNYDNAYFEFGFIKVFTQTGSSSGSSTSSPSSTGSGGSPSGSGSASMLVPLVSTTLISGLIGSLLLGAASYMHIITQ